MIHNEPFVEAVQREQQRCGETQESFAHRINANQSTLSKFYTNGVKDNLVIKILRKFPHLVIYFSEEQP